MDVFIAGERETGFILKPKSSERETWCEEAAAPGVHGSRGEELKI